MSAVSNGASNKETIGLIAAIAASGLVLLMPTPEGLGVPGQRMAALFVLILILWSTEALPIVIGSLLALVLQPILGLNDLNTAFQNFIGLVFFFVLIMFIVALAWVKTGLAHRFALTLITKTGTESRRVIYVFTIGTGLISLIVSDVPTCAIFMAVAIGIFEKLKLEPGKSQFAKGLMLAIPIGALVGGVGTIAGSSINVLGLQIIEDNGGPTISFLEWMAIGIPMVIILLPTAAFVISRAFKPEIADIGDIKKELADLGPLTAPEKKVVVIQALMVAFWIAGTWVPAFNVVTVGVFGATAMFLPGIRLFTWKEAQAATGWDILMMAGAITTLGAASSSSGLAQWLVDISLGGAGRHAGRADPGVDQHFHGPDPSHAAGVAGDQRHHDSADHPARDRRRREPSPLRAAGGLHRVVCLPDPVGSCAPAHVQQGLLQHVRHVQTRSDHQHRVGHCHDGGSDDHWADDRVDGVALSA